MPIYTQVVQISSLVQVHKYFALLAVFAGVPSLAQDVLTFHNDVARSGVQSKETILTTSNVNSNTFGEVFRFGVDADIYAQPLYISRYTMNDGKVHNVVLVATAHDTVYAIDADGNNPASGYLWKVSLLGTGETWVSLTDVNTSDISPDIGIVGTPVINRGSGIVYLVTKSKTTTSTPTFIQRLHALNLSNGTETLNGPTTIRATAPGTGDGGSTVSFSALLNNQRPALLLAPTPNASSASSIFIAWASHGDNGRYHGWVISYNAADISQQTGAWVDTPNGSRGGIWMSAGGLSTDGSGNIFGASGNGTFNAASGGSDYSESLFRLTLTTSGLSVKDWFTPLDQATLTGNDSDFGVGGASLILPNQTGPFAHLILTADKQGRIYLLNRDALGHFNSNANPDIQDFLDGGFNTIHSNLVFFNNFLYLVPDGGPAESWSFNTSTGLFDTTPQSKSAHTFGTNGRDGAGSNFTISANGTQNGILWAIDYSQYGTGPAVLHAFDTTNLSRELYNSAQAANNRDQAAIAVKFAAPTVANGRVYVGGRNALTVYGLLSSGPSTTAAPSFSPGGGTYTAAQTVTITDATPNATVYYTSDGSTPTTASPIYSKPILISSTTTLKAIATAAGFANSAVTSATYTISSSGGGSNINFSNGFTAGSMALNGRATINGASLRLTDGGTQEASSAFFPTPVNVQSFTSTFVFQLTAPNADGITFTIQGVGTTALGIAGGGLGYGSDTPGSTTGIGKSVAIKFDLYNNAGETPNSTGLYTNGASPTTPSTDLLTAGINLHSGDQFQVTLTYNGATLTATITDLVTKAAATQQYTVNIPSIVGASTAYAGFTGGTGGLTATQDIVSWSYSH